MSRILTVGFEFHDIFYYSLVNVKEIEGETQYKITVMNGDLEKMLLRNNIIKEKNGYLYIEISEDKNHDELKLKIAEALSAFLKLPLQKKLKMDKIY